MVSDGTDQSQDNSSDKGTETSNTYSEAQVAEIRRKAESDALANAGRATAAAEKATKIATDAIAKLKKSEDRAYEADRNTYRDEPDKLSALDANRRERDKDAELDEMRQKLSEATEARVISDRRQNVIEVAGRLGVDPKTLSRFAALTDGSPEAIEAEAKELPKVGEPRNPLLQDSSKGSGQPGYTREQLTDPAFMKRYSSDPAFKAEVDAADREGRIK